MARRFIPWIAEPRGHGQTGGAGLGPDPGKIHLDILVEDIAPGGIGDGSFKEVDGISAEAVLIGDVKVGGHIAGCIPVALEKAMRSAFMLKFFQDSRGNDSPLHRDVLNR
jgi:hypothetical protein